VIYAFEASRDYDPSARLESVRAPVLQINSADDFVNPPELGLVERLIARAPNAKFVLIPTSDSTRGHGTHSRPSVWHDQLADFLRNLSSERVTVSRTEESVFDNRLLDPANPEFTNPAPAVARLRFETSRGDFVLELRRDWGP